MGSHRASRRSSSRCDRCCRVERQVLAAKLPREERGVLCKKKDAPLESDAAGDFRDGTAEKTLNHSALKMIGAAGKGQLGVGSQGSGIRGGKARRRFAADALIR